MVGLGFPPFYTDRLFLNSPSAWYPKPWGYFENETRVSFSISKKQNAALAEPARRRLRQDWLITPRRDFQLGANMHADLGGVEVDEVPDLVKRNAPEFRPFPQRADGRLFARWENAAETKSDDIGELAGEDGSG